ncbi:MAG: polyhydroxyalkanoate synthesis repressor PhaR [Hyphomonadaceae bacterium]|jgi:polyhydroxyalkanoate synthesis repressor PhaR|nr:polyhydroxyalkanoate synthesis repressor PhaR [Hyphomonadaceae bacterium]
MSETIIIKKYANRRLYNTATSTYVTLDSVAALVRDGHDFVVEDARSGDDITRQILTQIIVESESAGEGLLPVGFLRDLIRQYSGGVGGVLPDYLDMSMKTFTEAKDQWTKVLTGAGSPQVVSDMFKSAMDRNLALMGEAARSFQDMVPGAAGLDAFWPKVGSTARAGSAGEAPERTLKPNAELEALKAQMAAMQEQLEKLAARDLPS